MNSLETTILEQYKRINAAGETGVDLLADADGEIMAVATPGLINEIISDHWRTSVESENRSSRAIMRSQMYPNSIRNRSANEIRVANSLADLGFLQPNQGYVGGLIINGDEIIVHSHRAGSSMRAEDPIAEVASINYPAKMWSKALRAEAYRHRSESERSVEISVWLARHGFTLGAMATIYGDIVGATGFMPGERIWSITQDEIIGEHVESETTAAFRLSGFCDQSVLDKDLLREPRANALRILSSGGTLC